MKALYPLTVALLLMAFAGCAPPLWRPALPSGKTWSYQPLQGRSTRGGERAESPQYSQLFSSEGSVGPRRGESSSQFWKRINVGTTHLNVRLINDGEAVRPGAQGPVVASDVAVPFDEEPTDHTQRPR